MSGVRCVVGELKGVGPGVVDTLLFSERSLETELFLLRRLGLPDWCLILGSLVPFDFDLSLVCIFWDFGTGISLVLVEGGGMVVEGSVCWFGVGGGGGGGGVGGGGASSGEYHSSVCCICLLVSLFSLVFFLLFTSVRGCSSVFSSVIVCSSSIWSPVFILFCSCLSCGEFDGLVSSLLLLAFADW